MKPRTADTATGLTLKATTWLRNAPRNCEDESLIHQVVTRCIVTVMRPSIEEAGYLATLRNPELQARIEEHNAAAAGHITVGMKWWERLGCGVSAGLVAHGVLAYARGNRRRAIADVTLGAAGFLACSWNAARRAIREHLGDAEFNLPRA